MAASARSTEGKPRILVVEDDVIVAMTLEEMVTYLGFEPVVCHNLTLAMTAAANEAVAFAIVDVSLGGAQGGIEVAETLQRRNIPFVVATGYKRDDLDKRGAGWPLLSKPFSLMDLSDAMKRAGLTPRAAV